MNRTVAISLALAAASCGWILEAATARYIPPRAVNGGPAESVAAAPAAAARRQRIAELSPEMGGSDDPAASAREWAWKNPQAFFEWLRRSRPQPKNAVVEAFFEAWIKSDPDAAFTAARNLPVRFGFQERKFFLDQYLGLLNRDPSAALRWLGRIEPQICSFGLSTDTSEAMGAQLVLDIPELDLSEVTAILKISPRSISSLAVVETFASQLAKRDLQAAAAWAAGLPPEHRATAMGVVLRLWAEKDLPAALNSAAECASSVRQAQVPWLLSMMAKSNPRDAVEWVQQHIGVTGYYLMEEWVANDAAGATRYGLELNNPQIKSEAINTIAFAYTQNVRPGTALEVVQWMNGLPKEYRLPALQNALPRMVQELTLPLLEDCLTRPSDDIFSGQIASLIGQNASRNVRMYSIVSEWAVAHPGQVADTVMMEMALQAKQSGPIALQDMLNHVPSGPQKTKLLQSLETTRRP